MTQLLVIREHMLKFYQKNARLLNPVFRFLAALVIFFSINQLVGYDPALHPWYVVVILSLISSALPAAIFIVLVAVYAVIHVYYASVILAMVLAVVFAIIYFVYVRFVPKHGYVILAVPLLYVFHIPYALPIILGLIAAPVSIVPMSCGVFVYFTLKNMITVIGTATDDSIALYNQVVQLIFSSKEMYLTMGIFAIVTIVIYIIRNHEFDYAFEISIFVGAFLNAILFLIINYPFDIHINLGYLLIETLISAVLAWVVQFFKLTLNYAGVEYLQFEDDEYYYYVKAVPKVNIAAPKRKVKRFNAHLFGEGSFSMHPEEKEDDITEPETSSEEENMDEMLEKHDFDFKVTVEDDDFEDKN